MSDFWTFYLQEHANPTNRALHLAGTSLAVVCIILSLVSPWFLLAGLLIGQLRQRLAHVGPLDHRPPEA